MSEASRARTFADDIGHSLGVDIHRATAWSIALSLLMMAAGVVALFVPSIAGVAATLVFGWLLIVSGVLHLVFAWQAGRASAVVWEILLALLYGGIGFYLLAKPVLGLETLTLALAIYLVFEGALEFILTFFLRPLPGSGWLLFDGVVTLLLAVLIWRGWPTSSTWVVGTLVGISMFFSGVTRLMLSLAVRRVVG